MQMDKDSINKFPEFITSLGSNIAYRRNPPKSAEDNNLSSEGLHVVFCGGFHSNMLGTKAQKLEEICSSNNLSYTRFDYRGHGESDGDPAAFDLTDWLNDTLLILDNIQHPIILVGSSMGGWLATLAASQRVTKIKGLLLIAPAPDFVQELIQPRLSKSDVWDLQQGLVVNLPTSYEQTHPVTQKLLDSGQDLSVLKSDPTTNTRTPSLMHTTSQASMTTNTGSQFDEDASVHLSADVTTAHATDDETTQETKSIAKLDNLTCPIRLIHGTHDADVPFDYSIRLMREFSQAESRLTLLSRADHRLSDIRSLACIEHELLSLVNDTKALD